MSDRSLRIAQVVADIWKESAGPSHSVTGLTRELDGLGHSVRLHTLEPRPALEQPFPVTYYKRWKHPYSLGVSPPMKSGLDRAAETADVMHSHGLWMMPNVYPGWAVKHTNCALLLSPRGTLNEWAFNWSKRRKALFWHALQRQMIERVDCFHATSHREAEAIRDAGFIAPIAIIPIGVDVPQPITERPDRDGRVLLFLGRLHPIKNVEALLRAWAQVEERHASWSLSIIGEGEPGYVAHLKHVSAELGTPRVTFGGPAYGEHKGAIYDSADLYILPTFSENFGVTIAEALSHGLPVITTRGAPWSGLVDHDAGWWIDPDASSIARALDRAMSTGTAELVAMGIRGREWIERDFKWREVASEMTATYRWLQGRGDQPACVSND